MPKPFSRFVKPSALRPAPPKPREWWINVYPSGGIIAHRSKKKALKNCSISVGGETIHVREVMPNDDKPRVWLPEWKDLNVSVFGFYYADGRIMFEEMYNQIRNKLMSLDK